MTSKNLSFNLMKEDMKRRVWTISLLALSFFFCIVVPMMFQISLSPEEFESEAKMLEYAQEGARRLLECENGMAPVILTAAAVVCAVSGFSYLYSAKKTDLYHSIPVKRRELFLAHFLDGIFMTGISFLISQILAAVLAAAVKVPLGEGLGLAVKAWAFHMSYYVLMYTTVVIAVMLTGNMVISLLGSMVFFGYVPGVSTLLSAYVQTYFETYHYTGKEFWNTLTRYGSPFGNYIHKTEQLSRGVGSWAMTAMAALAVSLLLALIAWQLYEKRPSEAAGKAMAFRISQTPIRILLVIPISLAFGMFFVLLRNTMGWGLFGLVCGAVLTHCLIEIIYHFDFRKLFSKKLHLGVCVAASLLIFCGFRFDWFGYDSYLPSKDNVESASVILGDVDYWVTHGEVKKIDNGQWGIQIRWDYMDEMEYAESHMKISELDAVLSIAEKGIENLHNYGQMRYQIQYHLKNGKTVNRDYYIDPEDVEAEIQQIFDMTEYKQGLYPLLWQTPEETRRVRFQQYNQMQEVEMSDELRTELLQTYQEELTALTAQTAKQELPIGTIQFMTRQMEEVLYDYRETVSEEEYSDTVYGIEERCYYPVYPSFTKTLALLEEAGVSIQSLNAETIDRIQVEIYSTDDDNRYYEPETKVYNQKEEIQALAPALVSLDYYGMDLLYEAEFQDDMQADVWIHGEDGQKLISCSLDASKLPDFLK